MIEDTFERIASALEEIAEIALALEEIAEIMAYAAKPAAAEKKAEAPVPVEEKAPVPAAAEEKAETPAPAAVEEQAPVVLATSPFSAYAIKNMRSGNATENPADPEKWTTGLAAYVWQNRDKLDSATPEEAENLCEKWDRIYAGTGIMMPVNGTAVEQEVPLVSKPEVPLVSTTKLQARDALLRVYKSFESALEGKAAAVAILKEVAGVEKLEEAKEEHYAKIVAICGGME